MVLSCDCSCFMEINGFLPGIDRLFADDSGRFQPAMLKTVVDIDLPELERQQRRD